MTRFLAITAFVLLTAAAPARAQHPERSTRIVEGVDFQVYGPDGGPSSFAELLAALDGAEAALVGEHHNDSIGHEVEREILIRAAQRFGIVAGGREASRPLVVSLEFFERDVQLVLDEYLADLITEDQFLESARPWDNYSSAYRPLVQFARAHGLPVVASNAPRRYTNRVTRFGPDALDDLSAEAKRFLPPLPYPGPSELYKQQFFQEMMEGMEEAETEENDAAEHTAAGAAEAEAEGAHPVGEEAEGQEEEGESADPAERRAPPNHGMGFALQSQALWDASMSHAVATALEDHPGALVLHYVGGFHVERHTGIPEKVLLYRPGTRIVTIVMYPAESVGAWDPEEHEGLGDFVILTHAPSDESNGSGLQPD